MITLYESILSSTKTGKYEIIDQWCKEHIKTEYEIKNNLVRPHNFSYHLRFDDEDKSFDIPNGLHFGDAGSFSLYHLINKLKENNIKGEIDRITVIPSDSLTVIDNKELIKIGRYFEIKGDYRKPIKEIKNLNLEFLNNRKKEQNKIDVRNNVLLTKKDIMNIKAKNVSEIILYNTSVSKEIQNDTEKLNETQLNKYLNNLTKNLEGITTVRLYATAYEDLRYYKDNNNNWFLLK